MTGFLTPYRHWMWKQNELWRNVHEAQFEHLRKVYKRQWLEAFRVNSDEYIYKYNITKAAQMATWELEMQEQEKKRLEAYHLAQGREALKKKHLDLLREFYERQFFYWYERASERLQYMTLIQYIPQSQLKDHIEKELDKYVAGSKEPYRLNFAGQLPMLEDKEGNIVEVPSNLMVNHTTENPGATATAHSPPQGVELAEERLLQMMASAQEEDLIMGVDQTALREAVSDVLLNEEAMEGEARVAKSMEETDEDREVNRRAYIDRGKIGSKALFRPKLDATGEVVNPTVTSPPPVKRRKKKDGETETGPTAATEGALPKVGEVGAAAGRLRDKVSMPSIEEIKSMTDKKVNMQDLLDKKYGRGKYKNQTGKAPEGEDL